MKKLVCLLFLLPVMLFTSCIGDSGDMEWIEDMNSVASDTYGYEGVWSIDDEAVSTGYMYLDSTFFTLRLMPCDVVMSQMMTGHKVENAGKADVTVACELVAQSEQALYFNINKHSFKIHANVDGEERIVDLLVGQYSGFSVGATATYSKLSDVYKVVFPITGYNIYDTEHETLFETDNKTLELTFTTTKRVYK